jgi:hypothetical protein
MAKKEIRKTKSEQEIEREIQEEELEPILKNANKPTWGHRIWVAIQVLFWMAVFVAGMWYYQQLKINELTEQKAEVTKQLQEAKEAQKKAEAELEEVQKELESTSNTVTTVPPLLKQTVEAAVASGNYAALDAYMADKVTYALAASSGAGTLTKAQALKQLEYLNSGTSPWNFNIATTTLTKYKSGAYSTYLNDDVIFGVSGNKYFVSFHLDSNNKIDQFFIASSTDLL